MRQLLNSCVYSPVVNLKFIFNEHKAHNKECEFFLFVSFPDPGGNVPNDLITTFILNNVLKGTFLRNWNHLIYSYIQVLMNYMLQFNVWDMVVFSHCDLVVQG